MFKYIIFVTLLALAFFLYPYSDPKHSGKKLEFAPRDGEVFVNQQGLSIYTNKWKNTNNAAPKGIVFLVHGLFEHSGRYKEIIELLNKEGYDVYTIDQQGHGQSEGDRAYVEEYSHFVRDTIQWIEAKLEKLEKKNIPTFLLGHSNGGLISTLVVIEKPTLVHGLILSAPLLHMSEDILDPTAVSLIAIINDYLPKLPLVSLDNSKLSHEDSVLEKIQVDDLHHKGKITVRTLYNILKTTNRLLEAFSNVTVPFFCMYGTEDIIVSPKGCQLLYDKASSEDKSIKAYEGYYHELFNEAGKEVVFKDLLDWLKKHV